MATVSSWGQARRRAPWSQLSAAAVGLAVLAVLLVAAPPPARAGVWCPGARPSGTIAAENARPGTASWRLTAQRGSLSAWVDQTSAVCGQWVGLHVATRANWAQVVVYRMGWYRGAGARQVYATWGGIRPSTGPASFYPGINMIETYWPVWSWLQIGSDWTPGEYLLKVTDNWGQQTYAPLTVRDPYSRAGLELVRSTLTEQAYNTWGGYSLYWGRGYQYATRSRKVSFDRPYDGDGSGQFFEMEYPLVQLAERLGLDITYTTDTQVDADPAELRNHAAVVFAGHAEYWTRGMYDGVTAARDAGVNVLFFGANNVYTQARLESTRWSARRHEVVYRSTAEDPMARSYPSLATIRWRDAPVSRPENQLVGQMYECWGTNANYVVANAAAWPIAGTGVGNGYVVPRLVGNEYDRVYPNGTPPGTMLLARSPVRPADSSSHCLSYNSEADSTYYSVASRAGVLSVGTTRWVCSLAATCAGDWGNWTAQWFTQTVTARALTDAAAGPLGCLQATVPGAPCAPPSGVTAVGVGTGSVSVAWRAVPTADEYRVVATPPAGSPTATSTVSAPATSSTLSGLVPGVKYSFTVTALRGGLATAPSAPVVASDEDLATPTGLRVSTASDVSLSVAWNAVAGAASYRAQLTGPAAPVTLTVTSPAVTFDGLAPGTTYQVTVTAVPATGRGGSAPSAALAATTVRLEPPPDLNAYPVAAGTVQLDWSAMPAATGYRVDGGPVGQPSHQLATSGTAGLRLGGLTDGLTYTFTATTLGRSGASPPSQPTYAVPGTPRPPAGQPLGGTLLGAPAITAPAPGLLAVAVRAPDNSVQVNSWTGQWWTGFGSIGGYVIASPTVVSWGPGRLDVFAVGGDRSLWHRAYYAGAWHGWEPLGGTIIGGPAAVSQSAGTLDIFVRGGDNALWRISWTGRGWTGFARLGGVLSADPAAVSSAPGRIDVIVRGTDDQAWHLVTGRWTWGWEALGGRLLGGAAAAARGPGLLDVLARGTDSTLWLRSWTGRGWTGWQPLGGTASSSPAMVAWNRWRLDVVYRGIGGDLQHRWWAGSWQP